LKAEKQAQLACQSMPAGSSQDSHEQPKAAQKQAVAEKAGKATPKELQQAEVMADSTSCSVAHLELQHIIMDSFTVFIKVFLAMFVVSLCSCVCISEVVDKCMITL